MAEGTAAGLSERPRAASNLWRGLFYRAYIARYLALHPSVSLEEIQTWMVLAAADRLHEQIAGEEEPLLRTIRSYLPVP